MARHWIWVVALLASGCAMQTAGETEDNNAQVHELPDTELRLDRTRTPPGPENLCADGQDEIHDGMMVHVPVPCVREDIDRGDPPPDAQERLRPGSLVEHEVMLERRLERSVSR